MKKIILMFFAISLLLLGGTAFAQSKGAASKVKSKFYDFSDQLIDGEIKKPTTLYTEAKKNVKFDRLLRLKKSFFNEMMQTSKDPALK
ncbi:MAG: hypothetical protein FJ088_05705 [Deltaproteobacteria bacterium]|nr:hypothetical protein [Deltaproteobacteria bacterium]